MNGDSSIGSRGSSYIQPSPATAEPYEIKDDKTTVRKQDDGKYTVVTTITITDGSGSKRDFKITRSKIKAASKEEAVRTAEHRIKNDPSTKKVIVIAHARIGAGGRTTGVSYDGENKTLRLQKEEVGENRETVTTSKNFDAHSPKRFQGTASKRQLYQTIKDIKGSQKSDLPPDLKLIYDKLNTNTQLTSKNLYTIALYIKHDSHWCMYDTDNSGFYEIDVKTNELEADQYEFDTDPQPPFPIRKGETMSPAKYNAFDAKIAKWKQKEKAFNTTKKVMKLWGGDSSSSSSSSGLPPNLSRTPNVVRRDDENYSHVSSSNYVPPNSLSPDRDSHYSADCDSFEQSYSSGSNLQSLETSLNGTQKQKLKDSLTNLDLEKRLAALNGDTRADFLQKVQDGDPQACKKYAKELMAKGRSDMAIAYLLPAANEFVRNKVDAEAQVLLGKCYFQQAQIAARKSESEVADHLHKKAGIWFANASQNGSSEGAYRSGWMLSKGLGVKNPKLESAKESLIEAQTNVHKHPSQENEYWSAQATLLLNQITTSSSSQVPQKPEPLIIDAETLTVIESLSDISQVQQNPISHVSTPVLSEEQKQLNQAQIHFDNEKYQDAYDILIKMEGADRGAQGEYLLGMILKDGLGNVPKDKKKALEHLELASTQAFFESEKSADELDGLQEKIAEALSELQPPESSKPTLSTEQAINLLMGKSARNEQIKEAITSLETALEGDLRATQKQRINLHLAGAYMKLTPPNYQKSLEAWDHVPKILREKYVQYYQALYHVSSSELIKRLGNRPAVQMMMGYRTLHGIGMNKDKERSSAYFRVAKKNLDFNHIQALEFIKIIDQYELSAAQGIDDIEVIEADNMHQETIAFLKAAKPDNNEISDFLDDFEPQIKSHVENLKRYKEALIEDNVARSNLAEELYALNTSVAGSGYVGINSTSIYDIDKKESEYIDIPTKKFIQSLETFLPEEDFAALMSIFAKLEDSNSIMSEEESGEVIDMINVLKNPQFGILAQRGARDMHQAMVKAKFFLPGKAPVLKNGPLNRLQIASIRDEYSYFNIEGNYKLIYKATKAITNTKVSVDLGRSDKSMAFGLIHYGGIPPKILGLSNSREAFPLLDILRANDKLSNVELRVIEKIYNKGKKHPMRLNTNEKKLLLEIFSQKIEPLSRLVSGNSLQNGDHDKLVKFLSNSDIENLNRESA
jgi:TPR repeat protein